MTNEQSLLDQLADRGTPFGIASDMGDTIRDVERSASALRIIARSDDIENHLVSDSLFLVSDMLLHALADLEERHRKLFRLLHPLREKFEREGWPSDKRAVEGEQP